MGHSALTCFKWKCTPVHEITTCVVAFMEKYTCCHFKVWSVHVMSTSIDRGQNLVNAHFPPKLFLSFCRLIEEGYSQACWSIVYLHWWWAASCRVSVIRVFFQNLCSGFRVRITMYILPSISKHAVTTQIFMFRAV